MSEDRIPDEINAYEDGAIISTYNAGDDAEYREGVFPVSMCGTGVWVPTVDGDEDPYHMVALTWYRDGDEALVPFVLDPNLAEAFAVDILKTVDMIRNGEIG